MIKSHVICLIAVALTTLSVYAQDIKTTRSLADLKKEVQERLDSHRQYRGTVNLSDIDPDKVFEALEDYQRAVQEASDKKAFTKPSTTEQFIRAGIDTLSMPDHDEFMKERGINLSKTAKIAKVAKRYAMPITFVYSLKRQSDEIMDEPRVKAATKLGKALQPGMVAPVQIAFITDNKGHAVALSLVAYNGLYCQSVEIPMHATDDLTIMARGLITKQKYYPDFVVTKKGVTQSDALQRNITIEEMLGQVHNRMEVHNKIINERFVEARSKLGEFNKRVNESLGFTTNTTLSDADVARVNAISQKIHELENEYKGRVAKNRFSPVDEDILMIELDILTFSLEPDLIKSITPKAEVRLALVKNTFLKETIAKQKQNALITDLINKSAVGDKNALAELYKEREKFRELEKKSPTYDQRVVERYLSERIGLIEARNKLQELEKKSPTYDQREMIRSLNREISKHESYGKSFQDRKNSDGRYNDDNYSAPSGWGGNSDGKYNDDNYSSYSPSKSYSDRNRDSRDRNTRDRDTRSNPTSESHYRDKD